MDEEHPLNPRSPYAATKAGADRLAYSYLTTYGLPIVIVRPFNNYGPRQHPEKVVPRFITQALDDEPLTIHGDGHASRDWLYVGDDAEAIERAIAAPIDDDRRRGDQRRDGNRHLRRRDRRPRARRARQAAVADAATSSSGRARSTVTSARPTRRNGCSAGVRARRSPRGWSGPSRGIARMRRGGERSSLAKPAPTRPRRRAGSARAARGCACARALDGGRRPRPVGARLPLRRPPLHPLDRGRAGDRPPRRRARHRRDDRAGHRLAGRRRRAHRRARSGCRIRSRRRPRCSPPTSCASASGSTRRVCRSRAGGSSAPATRRPRSSFRASSRRPTGRARRACRSCASAEELDDAIDAARVGVARRRSRSSRSSSPGPR